MTSERPTPDFGQLIDWVDGRLPAAEAAQLAAQAGQFDDRTRATVAWLRAFAAARQHAGLATPSARARANALRAFGARVGANAIPDLLRRLIATLTPEPKLSGVRAGDAAVSRNRRLSYSTTGFDIMLDINERRADGLFDIHGQVFATSDSASDTVAPDDGAVVAQLLRDDREQALAAANAFGEFVFGPVGAGNYAIVLRTARAEIEVTPVTLTV